MKSQSSGEYRGERLHALTARQARFIDAIAERILPATDTPGAIEAGAVFYIDRALAGPYPHLLSRYARGLRALNGHAKKQFGRAFEKLSDEQQDSLLGDLEAGKIAANCAMVRRSLSCFAPMCWRVFSASRATAATEI